MLQRNTCLDFRKNIVPDRMSFLFVKISDIMVWIWIFSLEAKIINNLKPISESFNCE